MSPAIPNLTCLQAINGFSAALGFNLLYDVVLSRNVEVSSNTHMRAAQYCGLANPWKSKADASGGLRSGTQCAPG